MMTKRNFDMDSKHTSIYSNALAFYGQRQVDPELPRLVLYTFSLTLTPPPFI